MTDDSGSGTRLRVSVVDADGRPLRAGTLASWLTRVAPRGARGQVTVALVSDRHVRRLNRAYRGADYATDVLSFPANGPSTSTILKSNATNGGSRSAAAPPSLGDIVIARGVAEHQAQRARHSVATEWRILALHGLLHLLGYDHEHDDGRMAKVERRLRLKGGLKAGLIERGAGT